MSCDTIFLRANMGKVLYALRSEVKGHSAPNVTLISSDKVEVKGHSIILMACPYFRELFKRDEAKNSKSKLKSKQGFVEGLPGDVLELVVKFIYTGEYSLLDPEKLQEILRATSEEKYNIPELAKGYLLEQFDAPGGLTQANWHLFYKNGIKLSLGEEYFNRIYAFLKEEHPEFYKSEEFKDLTYEQIYKMIKSPNHPFASTTIMEAFLLWTSENKVEMDKLAELNKICTNLVQNGNPNPQAANSPILDASVQSANGSLSTQDCPQPSILSGPHCSTTRKKRRSISHQIDTNSNSKRSNRVEVYQPPKYSWDSAQLLFFGKSVASTHENLWSYSFQTGEIKKMAKLPIENFMESSLLASQDRIYSIGGLAWFISDHAHTRPYELHRGPYAQNKAQDLVRSFGTNDLENMDKDWDEEPNLSEATYYASTLLFRNTIYLFPGYGSYKSGIEKWDLEGNPGIWENNNWDMLYNRESFGVALLDNTIYMVGGYGAKKGEIDSQNLTLNSAESYNIDDGTQTLLPNMNQARSNLQVVALKDRIYAIGGFNKNLASVESYKPGDPSWKQVANMNQPRNEGSAFILDDMIYVVGGNGYDKKPTMERYCPQEDRWTMVDIKLPGWAELSSTVLLRGPNSL